MAGCGERVACPNAGWAVAGWQFTGPHPTPGCTLTRGRWRRLAALGACLLFGQGCSDSGNPTGGAGAPVLGGGAGAAGMVIAGAGSSGSGATAGSDAAGASGMSANAGSAANAGGAGADGASAGVGAGSGGAGVGASGMGGMTAGAGGSNPGALGPLVRADGFEDAAPPLGEPLPAAPAGQWTWVDLPDAKCRDGSAAGLYVRYSSASPNFFIYLEGGGVCLDDFFCGINPKNVDETMNAESIIMGATGILPARQMPGNEGIFKHDPRNPVADWNAVYVPYCTGDIWGGNRPNATFPPGFEGLGGHTAGQHQFVGFQNTSIVLGRVVATFTDAQKTLISGSSAGGIGALLNAHRLADLMREQGSQARGFVISDSAVPFADTYLAPCTQKTWRELWGLDASFPSDCEDCFNADGGAMATSLAAYFQDKFPDETQVLGGLISSLDDEIISLFYGSALPNCTPTSYGFGTYQAALENFRDNVIGKTRFGTYFMPGTLHMHLWRARFYETNGTSTSIADWLTRILNNEAAHVAP